MVDQATSTFLDAIRAQGGKPLSEQTPEEFRAQVRMGSLQLAPPSEALHDVRDRRIPGPGGEIPVRIYTPRAVGGGESLPVVGLFHGAGFVAGDLDTHDAIARYYARHADAIVIAVDYRLAPEHRFPAAVDDAYGAVAWASEHARELGGDGSRLAVTGDSAGGNLAAVVCQLARDRGTPRIAFQALLYPVVDWGPLDRYPSIGAFGGGDYFLSNDDMEWFRKQYFTRAQEQERDPRASPILNPNLKALPPALVVTAGHDPLRDEGKAYADKLAAAGVPVEYRCFDDTVHAFVSFAGAIPAGIEALSYVSARMRDALTRATV
jgi:acetyl esterase